MRRSIRPISLLVLLALLLAACGASQSAAPTASAPEPAAATAVPAASGEKLRLIIGTGGTGGVFFPYGGGLARILTEKMPNTEATAQETGGSVDNMKLIFSDEAQIGMSTVDSAYDALNGTGAYQDTGKIPARTIAVLYQSFMHVVALEGSGVDSIEAMKGKRISVGSAGSSTEGAADRILEAAGLNPQDDITRENLSVADSVAAMKDGKIDAFFWIGGLPTAAVTDLVNTPNMQVTFLQADQYIPKMVEKYGPLYTPFTLPKDTYQGLEQDVPGIGIGNILFVNEKMPEDVVYSLLTTLFDNLADVQTIHPEAKKLDLATAWTGSSIPFHPGAIKFYKEKGVWKE
jgi:TRAP transporter TAXI family solute receptor